MRWNGSGPRLGAGRRRKSGPSGLQWALLLALVGGSAYLWIHVIGGDLDRGSHINARHADEIQGTATQPAGTAPTAAAPAAGRAVPGGPATAILPTRRGDVQGLDPVAQSLIAAARDAMARKITPSLQSVEDAHANSGSSFDLIDRGLADLLPLRTAIARHRLRDPHAYGLRARPTPSMDEHRRALTIPNLAVFLNTFALTVPSPSAQERDLEAGDIVLCARRSGQGPLLAAVVSDTADEAGNSQIVVLDPAAHTPRELSPQGAYVIRQHFRLHLAQVERARASLDLTPKAGTAL